MQRFITLAMNLVDVLHARPKAISALELYKLVRFDSTFLPFSSLTYRLRTQRKTRGVTEAADIAPAPTYFEEKKLGKQSKEDEAQRRASAEAAFELLKTVKPKNASSEGKVAKKQK